MKTPFYLITGFLGSGKTTFIKNLIDYFSGKKKIAIIQNEFAPANIDGKELKRTTDNNFDILEINNGSVFCVCLLSGFKKSLSQFLKAYQPEIVFMEASGLSDPIGIGEILNTSEISDTAYLAGIFCIVDANNFLKLNIVQQNIKRQVMIADYVIINKKDLCKQPGEIQTLIHKLNPHAENVFTSFCKVSLENIIERDKISANDFKNFFFADRTGRPEIRSIAFRSLKPMNAENPALFLNSLNMDIIRLKGYILLDNKTTLCINKVFDDIRIDIADTDYQKTELIALGNNLNLKIFRENYLNYCF